MRSPTQPFPFIRDCLKFVKKILVSKGERFFRIAAFDCITLSHISNEHSVLSFEQVICQQMIENCRKFIKKNLSPFET